MESNFKIGLRRETSVQILQEVTKDDVSQELVVRVISRGFTEFSKDVKADKAKEKERQVAQTARKMKRVLKTFIHGLRQFDIVTPSISERRRIWLWGLFKILFLRDKKSTPYFLKTYFGYDCWNCLIVNCGQSSGRNKNLKTMWYLFVFNQRADIHMSCLHIFDMK